MVTPVGSKTFGRGLHRGGVLLAVAVALVAGMLGWVKTPASAASDVISLAEDPWTSADGYQLNRKASLGTNELVLTPEQRQVVGSVFSTQKLPLEGGASFSAAFQFTFGPHGNGPKSDGIVFVLQAQSNTAGGTAAGIGYSGVKKSVGIEFDTYSNVNSYNDSNNNHVGLDVDGNITSIATANASDVGVNLGNQQPKFAWVDYNGATQRLEVRLSDSSTRPAAPLLAKDNFDVQSYLGENYAYAGFTAATGHSKHAVQKFLLSNNYVEGGLDLSGGTEYVEASKPTVTPMSVTANPTVTTSGQVSGSSVNPSSVSFLKTSDPHSGALTFNSNGAFTYQPNDGFVGSDSFTFQATNGFQLSDPATVTITVPALLTADPASLNFGDVQVGQEAQLPAVLRSAMAQGDVAYTIGKGGRGEGHRFTPSSPCSNDTSNDGGTLSFGSRTSCSGTWSFEPLGPGARAAQIRFSQSGYATELAVAANGIQGSLTSSSDVTLGEVPVGTSKSVPVTVTNSSGQYSAPVTIAEVDVTGNDPGFSVDTAASTCAKDVTLAKGGSCEVSVRFAPDFETSFVGDKHATLTVASNATNPGWTANVSATGTQAEVSVPDSVKFENTLSGSKPVTVTNTGDAPLQINTDKVAVTGDDRAFFSVDPLGCSGAVVLGGDTCTMTVDFVAEDEGSYAAALVIPSNAQVPTGDSTPDPVKVGLSATTPAAVLGAKKTLVPVTGVDTVTKHTVVVENTDDSATKIMRVGITGKDFSLVTSGQNQNKKLEKCEGRRLPAGQRCAVEVKFEPTSQGRPLALLEVTRKGQLEPDMFALSASAAYPVMSAPVEEFGPVPVGNTATQQVTVTNTGVVPLELEEVSGYTGEFGRNRDKCKNDTLAPRESCVVKVSFTPDQVGPRSTTIEAEMNIAAEKESIALTGYGTQPVVTADPVDFGEREVGTATTKTAVIANTGDAKLLVEKATVVDEKGANQDEFDVANASDCTDRAVKPGATCEIDVRFFPRDNNQSAARLKLKSNAAASPNSVALTGTGYTVVTLEEVLVSGKSSKVQAAEVLVPPGPVKNLKAPAKKRKANKFTATWKKPKQIGSAQSDSYLTRITKKGTPKKASRAKTWTTWKSQDWVPAPNGKLSKKFKKLTPNSTYKVQVRAHNIAGNGPKRTLIVTSNRNGIPTKYGTG